MDMAIMKLDLMKTINGTLPSSEPSMEEASAFTREDAEEFTNINNNAVDARTDLDNYKRDGVDTRPKIPKGKLAPKIASTSAETVFKTISLKLDLMKDVKSKRHNYTKLTSAGKNPAKKSPNASEALGAAYASGKMTENSVDADTNTETGATGKPKGSVADQYT